MTNGFAHVCERTKTEQIGVNTEFHGRYPFSGIAYRSARTDKPAINFAFNDLGQTYLRLNHVQWVKRYSDGSFSGLDIAHTWNEQGALRWMGRPAQFQLQSGQAAKSTKIAENTWAYENLDGSIPVFV
jgi:hypothetical protein